MRVLWSPLFVAFCAAALPAQTVPAADCRHERVDTPCEGKRLKVEIRTQLDFSRAAIAGTGGGTIRIDPNSGARSTSGAVVDLGGAPFAGEALLDGEPGRAVRVDLPASIRLTSSSGGSIEIVNLRTNLPPAPRLDAFGKLEFTFGGDLLVAGNISGTFRGRIPITAEYE